MTPLNITINEKTFQASRGQTILQAAQQNNIDIPTLCAYKDLPPFGGCRMCVVEVDKMRGFPTACTTPVEEGMIIRTETPALQTLRQETFNMLLSEHPLSCLVCDEKDNCAECMMTIRKGGVTTGCGSCPKNQQCELQTLSGRLGIEDIRLPVKYRMFPVEKFDPFYDRDYNLCILCGRCVQVCEKLHFLSTLSFVERGARTIVGTAFERNHVEAGCSFCGACVDRCPTGALTEKTRKWEGVADAEVDTTCPFCAAGCSLRLEVRRGVVLGSLPGADASVNAGSLCVHGRFGIPELVNHTSRLQKPWRLMDGRKFECSWEEAIELASEKLSACKPDQVVVQTSTSLPTEDLYLVEKFAHQVLHIPVANDKTTVPPSTFELLAQRATTFDRMRNADCILMAGLDTRYSFNWLEYDLKQLKHNGAFLISINNEARPLDRFVHTFLQTSDGEVDSVFSQLTQSVQNKKSENGLFAQAAQALNASQHPVILVGPEFMNEPKAICQLSILAEKLNAGVICLPVQGNFYGALLTGALNFDSKNSNQPEVLYCIGTQPDATAGYIIYQNAFAPDLARVDIGLPTAVFTERDGTFYNAELRQRQLIKAVEPPGISLPDWQILTAIARKMGAAGFEFQSTSEIREEFLAAHPLENLSSRKRWFPQVLQQASKYEPDYLGSPLSTRVDGLHTLFPSGSPKSGEK